MFEHIRDTLLDSKTVMIFHHLSDFDVLTKANYFNVVTVIIGNEQIQLICVLDQFTDMDQALLFAPAFCFLAESEIVATTIDMWPAPVYFNCNFNSVMLSNGALMVIFKPSLPSMPTILFEIRATSVHSPNTALEVAVQAYRIQVWMKILSPLDSFTFSDRCQISRTYPVFCRHAENRVIAILCLLVTIEDHHCLLGKTSDREQQANYTQGDTCQIHGVQALKNLLPTDFAQFANTSSIHACQSAAVSRNSQCTIESSTRSEYLEDVGFRATV